MKTLPFVKDLVLIGGGHTHALVLRKWGMNPLAGVRVTVIDPNPRAAYSGMLPGFVAGHYTRDELDIDLVQLSRFAGARIINGAVNAIDPLAKRIMVPGRPPIAYDVCALDVGITSDMPMLDGFRAHATPAKPLGPFASKWTAFRTVAINPQVAVIGGGVAGAELALAMAHALTSDGHAPVVHLIDRSGVLTALGDTARAKMLDTLAKYNVTVLDNAPVAKVTADGVLLENGDLVPSQFTTGAAGAKPHDWHSQVGVDLLDGYIAVDENLQSSDASIFAVGDCVHLTASPRPKAGVFAVREAPVLFDNLRAVLSDKPLRPYRPQKDYLKLVSLGDKIALAEKWGRVQSGALLWKWKDQIDRKFMDQFTDLPVMGQPDLPREHASGLAEALGDKPMCGGCGAKVGPATLASALVDLPDSDRDDVDRIDGDDAGVIKLGGAVQVISTDHLRAFTHDPVLMTQIAAVHALGDIWAMGAAPQAATVNLVLPRMSDTLQARTMSEIMATAQAVFSDAGAVIVGGHTSIGDELIVGFTITGLCDVAPITRSGAMAGDALILTKPIGSGVILAAEMQSKARGSDVVAAFDAMTQGQAAASQILKGAHAMTDVTGFGLAGHLNGICVASGLGAELVLDDIPVLPGALTLAEAGHRSSLYEANVAGAAVTGKAGARMKFLFDPQTAGGLLAAVAPDDAAHLLGDLKAAGYQAAVIGHMTNGAGVKAR